MGCELGGWCRQRRASCYGFCGRLGRDGSRFWRVAEYFVDRAHHVFDADLRLDEVAIGTEGFAALPLVFG